MMPRRDHFLSLTFCAAALGTALGCATPGGNLPPTIMPTPTAIPAPAGMTLVWHDEFDGPTLDPANWTYDLGGGGWGNGESQIYTQTPENARIENGILIIEARKEPNDQGGYQFTSARLKTLGLQAFQYGRIEARLKVPTGKGLWPAFWMLGENFPAVGWPDCGEIDIMEYVGREPNEFLGTLHGPGYSGALGPTKSILKDYAIAADFHTFAIEWEADEIRWYYDGELYSTYTRQDIEPKQWVFDQRFFIILNLAVGGTLGGLVHPDTAFPAQYQVDYVRVFQK